MKYGVKWETVGRGESRGGSATPKQGAHHLKGEAAFGCSGSWESCGEEVGNTNKWFLQKIRQRRKLSGAEEETGSRITII